MPLFGKSSKNKSGAQDTSRSCTDLDTKEDKGHGGQDSLTIDDVRNEVQKALTEEMVTMKRDVEQDFKHQLQMLKKEIDDMKNTPLSQHAKAIAEESSVDGNQHPAQLFSQKAKMESTSTPSDGEESTEINNKILQTIEQLQRDMKALTEKLNNLEGEFNNLQQETKAAVDDIKRKEAESRGLEEGKSGKKGKKEEADKLKHDAKALPADTERKMSSLEEQSKRVWKETEEVKTANTKLREEMEQLRKENEKLRSEVNSSLERINNSMVEQNKTLETKLESASKLVSFHAQLTKSVETDQVTTLVCDGVVDNTSNSYSRQTGVFTAPVSGTYCFLATSSPDPERTEDEDVAAALDMVVDGKVKGGLCSFRDTWSSGHCVVRLRQGQRVWLRTLKGRHMYEGGWWTTFSGMLLQAQV